MFCINLYTTRISLNPWYTNSLIWPHFDFSDCLLLAKSLIIECSEILSNLGYMYLFLWTDRSEICILWKVVNKHTKTERNRKHALKDKRKAKVTYKLGSASFIVLVGRWLSDLPLLPRSIVELSKLATLALISSRGSRAWRPGPGHHVWRLLLCYNMMIKQMKHIIHVIWYLVHQYIHVCYWNMIDN